MFSEQNTVEKKTFKPFYAKNGEMVGKVNLMMSYYLNCGHLDQNENYKR